MERRTKEEGREGTGAEASNRRRRICSATRRRRREVLRTLPRVAESDLPVLVLGETERGKELMRARDPCA
jgi:transcriptional regulator with GAF, ATPase, and Fis domain